MVDVKNVKNILVIKTSSLGDIIHTYPAIDFIHRKFPNARIDWVVEAPNAELVSSHPYVRKAICVSTKAWRKSPFSSKTLTAIKEVRQELRQINYDVVFDFQGNTKSGLLLSQVWSQNKVGFGSSSVPEWPNLLFTNRRYNPKPNENIRNDYLALVEGYFGSELSANDENVKLKISNADKSVIDGILSHPIIGDKMKVMVCPGSAWPNKQLTQETLAELLDLIEKQYHCSFIFAWGAPDEFEVVNALHQQLKDCSLVIDRMRLPMLQNLMGECDLVIAMDSLPLHLAGTTKTSTYSVFGASSALKYNPLGVRHGALQGDCPYGRTFVKRCPVLRTCPTGACIHSLQASNIFAHFKTWLTSSR